jgi:hypothetical protein
VTRSAALVWLSLSLERLANLTTRRRAIRHQQALLALGSSAFLLSFLSRMKQVPQVVACFSDAQCSAVQPRGRISSLLVRFARLVAAQEQVGGAVHSGARGRRDSSLPRLASHGRALRMELMPMSNGRPSAERAESGIAVSRNMVTIAAAVTRTGNNK